MKSERQNKIIELITQNSIGTQEELAEALKDVHRRQKSEVCCLSGGQTAYERQIYPGLKGRVCRC